MKRVYAMGCVLLVATILVLTSCASTPAGISTTVPQSAAPATASPSSTTMPTATTTPAAQKPKYGGALTLLMPSFQTLDLLSLGPANPQQLTNQRVWDGDWAKGPAGGYGTDQVSWADSTNIPDLHTGYLAESLKWTVNSGNQTVTTVMDIRQGVHWALDHDSEASRLVGGREVTADDIVYTLNQDMHNPAAMNAQFTPWEKDIYAVKTGPWEVSVTLPLNTFMIGAERLFDGSVIFAPELQEKYGRAADTDWRYSEGTGPFMLTDFVSSSSATLVRNPNYWMKDPVGPGKGNQLPYLNGVTFLIIPDTSTQQAALRTGKLDQLSALGPDDAAQISKQVPALKESTGGWNYVNQIEMRTDTPPFNDLRVRQALMMATDFNSINNSLYQGQGQILSWPYYKTKAYASLYLGLDDPEMPESVKELYTYSPNKAKQLLAQAGYPNGFESTLLLPNTTDEIDYYSIVKDMWSKVGVDLTLKPTDTVALYNIMAKKAYTQMVAGIYPPPSSYPEAAAYSIVGGWTWSNGSLIDDPKVNAAVSKWNVTAVTDLPAAMAQTKDLMKYVLAQAWVIPTPIYPNYTFWWPWLKNYDGELTVGWIAGPSWTQWVWVDQQLKSSMGY